MPAPRKYSDEMKDRAVRMVIQVRRESGQRYGAIVTVATKLGINRETLRGWVRQSEIDSGQRPGISTADAQRIAELERENRELKRARFSRPPALFSPGRWTRDCPGSGVHRQVPSPVRGGTNLPDAGGPGIGLAYIAAAQDRRADAFATLDEAHTIARAHGAHAIVRHIEQARTQI